MVTFLTTSCSFNHIQPLSLTIYFSTFFSLTVFIFSLNQSFLSLPLFLLSFFLSIVPPYLSSFFFLSTTYFISPSLSSFLVQPSLFSAPFLSILLSLFFISLLKSLVSVLSGSRSHWSKQICLSRYIFGFEKRSDDEQRVRA